MRFWRHLYPGVTISWVVSFISMERAFCGSRTIWVVCVRWLVWGWWQRMRRVSGTFLGFILFSCSRGWVWRPLRLATCRRGLSWVFICSLSLRRRFMFSIYEKGVTIFCRMRMAFFLTKSVAWCVSLITASMIPLAMVLLMILPRAVRQITT